MEGGKDAAVGGVRAVAESAGKAATKKVGEKVAKEIARGVITETVEDVWQQGTKLTIERMGGKVIFGLISNAGVSVKAVSADVLEEVLTQGAEEFLKGSTATRVVFELTQKAATTAAEEECKKHVVKLFA